MVLNRKFRGLYLIINVILNTKNKQNAYNYAIL